MKKIGVFAVMFLAVFAFAQAGDWKLSEVRFASGRGAFTSGLDGSIFFASERNAIEITGNHERVYGVYFWKFPSAKLKIGICAGAFKNMVQTGPYIVFAPVKFASVFYWRAWGFGEPNKPGWKTQNFFEAMGASVSLKGVGLSYIYMVFQGEKTHLPGISYAASVGKNFKVFAGVDYKTSIKTPLFRIGASYVPKR